jgi:toxin ParE1/3/4
VSAKTIVQRSLAHLDVEKAVSYYLEVANSAIALEFVDALEAGYDHIGRNPATGSPRYAHEINLPGLRAWPLTKYPYLIFYVEFDQHIDVWRVLHMAIDIPNWLAPD